MPVVKAILEHKGLEPRMPLAYAVDMVLRCHEAADVQMASSAPVRWSEAPNRLYKWGLSVTDALDPTCTKYIKIHIARTSHKYGEWKAGLEALMMAIERYLARLRITHAAVPDGTVTCANSWVMMNSDPRQTNRQEKPL